MIFILKYFLVYPILYVIDWLDYTLDVLFVRAKRDAKFKGCPSPDEPYTIQTESSETSVAYRSARRKELFRIDDENINLYDAIARSARKFADRPAMGAREIIAMEDQKQPDGKTLKKQIMKNEYSWITYREMLDKIDHLANGFLHLGLKSNDNVVIFSETRAEWMMCAVACFKIKVPVVTLYSTLGLDALVYGIHQTKANYLIASGDSVQKVLKIIDKVDQLTHVIVFTDKFTEKNAEDLKKKSSKLSVVTLNELEKLGKSSKRLDSYERPKKDDLAMIMYTSGSTGQPKGVMKSHGNLLTSVSMFVDRLCEFKKNGLGIGYLPLAHSLELCTEIGWLLGGVQIGYSSPFTLIDTSTAIKEGHLGDIRVLKPNLMMGVPIMLERIKKAVEDKLTKQSGLLKTLFEASYAQKLKNLRAGRSSTILDKIVFAKMKEALGGRVEVIIVGGSILNKDVHEFAQVCFCSVVQAYGLTETSCATTGQYLNDTRTGEVGAIVECCEIRLVDWPEGNYRCTDKPNPRGEVWVGGDAITMGYYNMPEKTLCDYRTINGIRFFATGDIGEMTPHGNLVIIDRKKDLVKLQGGEYVSLNKVETVIKLMPLVDNCCVIANPSKSFCVCLITPNVKKAQEFLHLLSAKNEIESTSNGKVKQQSGDESSDPNFESLTQFMNVMDRNDKLRKEFAKELFDHCLKHGLERFEIPTRAKFVREVWLPDSGLVTDSLKLKRKDIERFYANEIKIIYS